CSLPPLRGVRDRLAPFLAGPDPRPGKSILWGSLCERAGVYPPPAESVTRTKEGMNFRPGGRSSLTIFRRLCNLLKARPPRRGPPVESRLQPVPGPRHRLKPGLQRRPVQAATRGADERSGCDRSVTITPQSYSVRELSRGGADSLFHDPLCERR